MKIPRKLKIRRSKWTVKFDDKIEQTEKAVGLCIRSTKQIFISPNQDRNEIEETFIHELLHACWPEDVCSDRLEEKIIAPMAGILYSALKEGRLLVPGAHAPATDAKRAKLKKTSSRKRKA